MTITERNKQNSQHAKGPSTPAGRARSSQNALKTGIYSATALLSTEDPEQYRLHTESYVVDLQPQGPVQCDLVRSISDDAWTLRRLRDLVASQHAHVAQLDRAHGTKAYDIKYQTAQGRLLDSFTRNQQRAKNAIHKNLKLLKELQQVPRQKAEIIAPKPKSGFVPNNQSAAAAAAASTSEFTAETTFKPTATAGPPLGAAGDAPADAQEDAPEKVAA